MEVGHGGEEEPRVRGNAVSRTVYILRVMQVPCVVLSLAIRSESLRVDGTDAHLNRISMARSFDSEAHGHGKERGDQNSLDRCSDVFRCVFHQGSVLSVLSVHSVRCVIVSAS